MEHFFEYNPQENLLWLEELIPVKQSAFVEYATRPVEEMMFVPFENNRRNIKKRVREFLIRSHSTAKVTHETEKERCRRHVVSERMRREKQRENYLELHSFLPYGTKKDKNSIILMAAKEIKELQSSKEHLERQNNEIVKKLLVARESKQEMEQAQINIRVSYPLSGLDSMLEVLKCLKQTATKTTAIQSNLSTQELSAVFKIETQVGAAEVENAVLKTLFQVERKFRIDLLEQFGG